MATLPAVMGEERENSIQIKRIKDSPYELRQSYIKEDGVIADIEALLLEKYGAVPFGTSDFNLGASKDAVRALIHILRNASNEFSLFRGRLIDGVILPAVARFYREALNPYLEVSTITCDNPYELCRRIRLGEQIAGFLARTVSDPGFCEIWCLNAVSDRGGTDAKGCGMHGNYLKSREFFNRVFHSNNIDRIPPGQFSRALKTLIAFRTLGIIFSGEGKVGYELYTPPANYQISGRADFIGDFVGVNTGGPKRPLVNCKDEPHADREFFSRFHVTNNEGTRSPWSVILNHGLNWLVLAALEDDALNLNWNLSSPIESVITLSRDLEFCREIPITEVKNGHQRSDPPLDLFLEIFKSLDRYISWAHVPSWCHEILGEAERIVNLLKEKDPAGEVSRMLDWAIKKKYIEKKAGHEIDERVAAHPWTQAVDLGWHRLDKEKMWVTICEEMEVKDFDAYYMPYGEPSDDPDSSFWNPPAPQNTRSYLSWFLLNNPHFRERTVVFNWETLKIWNDSPSDAQIIFLGDPRKFNEAHIKSLMENDPDFSAKEKRGAFIKKLKEENREHQKIEIIPKKEMPGSPKNAFPIKSIPRRDSPPLRPMPRESDDIYERSLGLMGYGNDTDTNATDTNKEGKPESDRATPQEKKGAGDEPEYYPFD